MKHKPSRSAGYTDSRSAGSVLPAAIGGTISPRTVFVQMTAGEIQSGRYSRSAHRKLLKLAGELGLRRADAEEIISRCCQEYAQISSSNQQIDSRGGSQQDQAFRRFLTRAFAMLILAALIDCFVI